MKLQDMFKKIKQELDSCKRPLFFFDSDADGLSAFLLVYRYVREGKGVIIKSKPVGMNFLNKVEEYDPDKIFFLDTSAIDQEFIDAVKRPVIVIDHHEVCDLNNVKAFNVKLENPDYVMSTSHMCYEAVKQDQWLALVGCIGDWFLPPYAKEFSKEHPDLLPKTVKTGEDALFGSKIGSIAHMFWFLLKGKTSDAMKCVKALTRINDPKEILEQSTAAGKFIYKRFKAVDEKYQRLISEFKRKADIGPKLVFFKYKEGHIGFSSSLSNKMMHKYHKKTIIIAREKTEEVICSLRSSKVDLLKLIDKALVGIRGSGGGHKRTCGVRVDKDDFERFMENVKREL